MPSEISVIITIYNKSFFLPDVIKSLLSQTISSKMEYIFVDDASTDNSVNIIEQHSKNINNVTIIKNKVNLGPSVRLNQGAKKAKGKFLLLIDGDDIIFNNAAEVMLELLKSQQADFIYGKRQRLEVIKKACVNKEDIDYTVSTQPLKYILTHRNLVNMAAMVKTSLFSKAKGCDERVFIQDESLPLRLAAFANKFIDLKTSVVGIIPEEKSLTKYKRLSSNSSQQYHDRFLVYYYFIADNMPKINDVRHLLYKRCISTMWKYFKEQNMFPYYSMSFVYYLISRLYGKSFSLSRLDKIKHEFSKQNNIRRM